MSEPTELNTATRDRLEQELAQAREQRRTLAAQLGGEDPDNPDTGDRGDYLRAIVRLACEREDLGPDFRTWLRSYVAEEM